MSETRRETAEEAAVLRVLEALNPDPVPSPGGERDEEVARLVRELTEVVGLLPYALPPVAPSPELEARILARIRDVERSCEEREMVLLPRTASAVAPPRPPSRRARPRPAVAAVLALCLLGLGGALGWILHRLEAEHQRTVALPTRLEQSGGGQPERGRALDEAAELERRFRLVTAHGTRVCPLRPPTGAAEPRSAARGVLFVAAERDYWYLKLQGLEPVAGRGVYQVWFISGDGGREVSAGAFEPSAAGAVELSSSRFPAHARAVYVTLEESGGASQPSGPVVLYGDEVMQLL